MMPGGRDAKENVGMGDRKKVTLRSLDCMGHGWGG